MLFRSSEQVPPAVVVGDIGDERHVEAEEEVEHQVLHPHAQHPCGDRAVPERLLCLKTVMFL